MISSALRKDPLVRGLRQHLRALPPEAGFNAIVVEADWPDAWRVNRYIRGDETRPARPLVAEPEWHAGEPAEAYPSGL